MAKILLVVLSLFTFSVGAKEADQKFNCENVGGNQEWTIYIDLSTKHAEFFNNDTTVKVPLTDVKTLESFPPQTQYIFTGRDPEGGRGAGILIGFNATRKSAYVTFTAPGSSRQTLEAKDGCVPAR